MTASETSLTAAPGNEKLAWWRKIGYGLGDIYGGGSSIIISFYYLVFLTDVVRLNPNLAGIVILVSKVYDSVTDPFEGILSDRTRTRFGRRRPYLAAGVLLIFISFFLLFYPVSFASEGTRFVFVLLSYLFFSTVVSIVMLNYNALQSELTLDYDERTALSSVRIFFSTASSILSALLPLEIVKLFPDVRTGWMAMALFFGVFFAVPFVATVLTTRERPEFQHAPRPFDWREAFIEPFQMRSFVYVLMMYLFSFISIDAVGSLIVFYMKNYLGRGGETSYVSGWLLCTQVISLPFYVWFSKRTNKRRGFILGVLIWMVTMLFSFAVVPGQPAFMIYLFAGIIGFGTGGVVVMIYAIFPDIPDIDELRSGERREGIYSAMFTFMRKLSAAIALFVISQVIGFAGYIPPIEEVVEGGTRLVEQPQAETFINTLRLVFMFVPILALSVALFFALKYMLTPQVHARLRRVLYLRRSDQEETPEIREEAKILKKLLI